MPRSWPIPTPASGRVRSRDSADDRDPPSYVASESARYSDDPPLPQPRAAPKALGPGSSSGSREQTSTSVQAQTSAPPSARQGASSSETRVKSEPTTYRYIIVQLMDEATASPVHSNNDDGDILVVDWMFDKIFVLEREAQGLKRTKKDKAILRIASGIGGQKMSSCAEWDGIDNNSLPIEEKD